MAEAAVFASGNGSNFEAIVQALSGTEHRVSCLICDQSNAFAVERARRSDIPTYIISGWGKDRRKAEGEALRILDSLQPEVIVLAGFMRILTPDFLDRWPRRVINIHPSLLPKYPGTRGIEESFLSGDPEVGITIHYVDYGTDTGPIILQKTMRRIPSDSLEVFEEKIHTLEHTWYPQVVRELLEGR